MTAATVTHLRAGPAFAPAQLLAARLSALEREINEPDDSRQSEFWHRVEQFQAVEASARRATGWKGCMFGPDAHCPASLPVNCNACASEGSLSPVKVIYEWVETDANGRRWDCAEVDF